MHEFLVSSAIGVLLIIVCSLNIYEWLRYGWSLLPRLTLPPRQRVMVMLVAVFLGHIINIWIFGVVYYFMITFMQMGTLVGTVIDKGEYALDIFGCVYFSAVSYTTVGFGDITPEGGLRMISSVESLAGFILIGWTVSFTYLAMQKFWELPHRR